MKVPLRNLVELQNFVEAYHQTIRSDSDWEYKSNLSQETAQGTRQMWSYKTGALSTPVNYSENKITFSGLKGQSLSKGSHKDRFDCKQIEVIHLFTYLQPTNSVQCRTHK